MTLGFLNRLPLATRVAGLFLFGIMLVSGVTTLQGQRAMTADAEQQAFERQDLNMRIAWKVLDGIGHNATETDGGLRLDGRSLDNDTTAVDEISRLVGGMATIFHGDLRIATNVTTASGARAIGTKLAAGPVRDAVLRDGKPYRGEAMILGQPFLTAYDPIKAKDGHVIGILFTGIPRAVFFARVDAFQRQAMIAAALAALSAAAAMLWVMGRMFAPLKDLRRAMDRGGRYSDSGCRRCCTGGWYCCDPVQLNDPPKRGPTLIQRRYALGLSVRHGVPHACGNR